MKNHPQDRIVSANELLSAALDIGKKMLESGAEISRAENTVERICESYGAKRTDVFFTTAFIFASVQTENGESAFQARRIRNTGKNLAMLEYYNGLSRKICREKPALDSLSEAKAEVKSYPFRVLLLSASLTSGVFALSFGGAWRDAIAAAIIGLLIYLIDRSPHLHIARTARVALASFTAGFLSSLAVSLRLCEGVSAVMLGTVLILLPGLTFGSAFRDLLSGDLLSGCLEAVRSFITALTVALGYLPWLLFFDIPYAPVAGETSFALRFITLFFGIIGFSVLFNIKKGRLAYTVLGALSTFLLYNFALFLDASVFASSLTACLFASFYSEACARVLHAPATVFFLPCTLTVVPGKSLYAMMSYLIAGNTASAASEGFFALSSALGIAFASVLSSVTLTFIKEALAYIRKKSRHNRNISS